MGSIGLAELIIIAVVLGGAICIGFLVFVFVFKAGVNKGRGESLRCVRCNELVTIKAKFCSACGFEPKL